MTYKLPNDHKAPAWKVANAMKSAIKEGVISKPQSPDEALNAWKMMRRVLDASE